MIYYFASALKHLFGPARLLQSHTVLIGLALYTGFFITKCFLPRFYPLLPSDRGREFTLTAEAAKGKPTGAGIVFISFFVIIALLFAPVNRLQTIVLALTWITMLTGFLDDRSAASWGEYRKAAIDLVICIAASLALYFFNQNKNADGNIMLWLPFVTHPVYIATWIYMLISVVLLWAAINTTNCTDGVDGLSGTLVLVALITMGSIFYFILGHKDIAAYLLVPHLDSGASWGIITFTLAGTLMGYLWHNAFPSKVLMGDAGSRAVGFFIGICVMISGNPFLLLATSSIILVNGGMGLLKVALLRFFKISIFETIRFPLHDHMRKKHNWSVTQVLVKFLIMQVLITLGTLGIFLKIR